MTTCLIIDDEPLARRVLEEYISKVPELSLLGSCQNAIEAISVVKKQQPEIIFCDVKMPELSGLEFIKLLEPSPKIILTTAYQEFALDGFDLGVCDYLLKPIRFERFLKAVGRAMPSSLASTDAPSQTIEEPAPAFLFFKTEGTFTKVFLEEIKYVEAWGNYVKIHYSNKPLLVKDTLSAMEELLGAKQFVRIHKSFLVAKKEVKKYFDNTVLIGEIELPVGNFYKKDFLQALGIHA